MSILPAFEENNIGIVFSANNLFVPYMSVMIQSVMDHASSENNYDLLILHNEISEENQDILYSMVENVENFSLRFIDVGAFCDGYSLYTSTEDNRLTREAYYRLLIPNVLSEEYQKAIYLDGDMVTLTDVAELFKVDLEGCYLAAPYDVTGIGYCHLRKSPQLTYRKNVLKLSDPDSYFISGLIVLNLEKLRQDYSGMALMELAASRDWKQHDQDVLNVICDGGKAVLLHPEWNVLSDYGNNRYLPDKLMQMWLESEKKPKVIHYGGSKKPWNMNVIREEYFWKTAAKTPFFGTILQRMIYSSMHYSAEQCEKENQHIESARNSILSGETAPRRNSILAWFAQKDNEPYKTSPDLLISVIICAYNEEKHLSRCLESVINQTYQNLEIIIVDDGSTDGTADICDRYADLDNRIHVIHKQNGGVASARNAGLQLATGDYIGWVDADDWIACDMYEYLVRGVHEYQTPAVICGHIAIRPNSQKTNYYCPSDRVMTTREALKMLFSNQIRNYLYDRIWERGLFDGIRFEDGVVFEDFRVVYRLIIKAGWVTLLKTPKYYHCFHDGSIVNTFSVRNRLQALQAHMLRYNELFEEWPDLKVNMMKQICEAVNSFRYAVKQDSSENYILYQQEINEVIEFLKKHRTEYLQAMNAGVWRTRAFDCMLSGTRSGWLKADAILWIGKKKNSIGKYKKRIKNYYQRAAKGIKQIYARGKRKIRKILIKPSPKEESAESYRLRKELTGLLLNAKEGESQEEIKRRFFMSIRNENEDIALMQRGNLLLLRWLKKVCQENGIQFWILGGTMLGAVRHKGYIPWDDDVDVGILRGEMEKLTEVIRRYPDFELKRYYYTKGAWQTVKLTYNNDKSPFWIDLLVYDYAGDSLTPEGELWAKIQQTREWAHGRLLAANSRLKKEYVDEEVFDEKDAAAIDRIYADGLNALPAVIERAYIYRSVDCVCAKWQQLFPCERMMPFCELEFEGEMYPAPKDVEWYLKLQYGDYLTIPGDIGHMHSRFIGNKLKDKQTINQILQELSIRVK